MDLFVKIEGLGCCQFLPILFATIIYRALIINIGHLIVSQRHNLIIILTQIRRRQNLRLVQITSRLLRFIHIQAFLHFQKINSRFGQTMPTLILTLPSAFHF